MSAEIAASLKALAEPRPGGDYTKAAIERAAKRSGLGYWRAFDIWYGKARRIEQFEIDQINDALGRKRREDERNELHELQIRIARLEARLAQGDPDFHRPMLDGLGHAKAAGRPAVAGLGGMVRSGRGR